MKLSEIPVGHVAKPSEMNDGLVLRADSVGVWLMPRIVSLHFRAVPLIEFGDEYQDLGPFEKVFSQGDTWTKPPTTYGHITERQKE